MNIQRGYVPHFFIFFLCVCHKDGDVNDGDNKMIVWLFFSFLALGVILTIFGFVADISLFNLTGTIIILLLGISLLSGGLDYKVGENVTSVTDGSNITTQQVVDVYGNYDDSADNRIGWFLIALGSLAFVFSLFEL